MEEAGGPTFDEVDGEQRLTGGVVVRHLMLPGALEDSKRSCASCTSVSATRCCCR